MRKDTHLINIYLKIHNKKTLTMDDLRYLAKYAPECFEKTCKNVVYNLPEAKPVMDPPKESASSKPMPTNRDIVGKNEKSLSTLQAEPTESQRIEQILDNLKRLEANDFPIVDIDSDNVKTLLGNLYMELLFPHNDKDTFFGVPDAQTKSSFDKRA